MNTTKTPFIFHAARFVAAVILIQTLYFKFTGSPESVYIFTTVGMEPWGRFGIGGAELIAGVLLVIRTTAWIGAGLALGLMAGAIMMHLTILGIVVQDDGGYLFALCLVVTFCSAYVVWHEREAIATRLSSVLKKVS